ncbi:MAG: thiamine pyrophosphate-dependent enzyme [Arhodomonas sp.]|nr:thiamine pyrophosphate-dependent enzyme [Arhodomonas sp.]
MTPSPRRRADRQIPQAAGLRLRPETRRARCACSICYFGEGAASEGDFHAALNMAAVIRCPAIFLCRNNGYAISTPVSEQYAGDGVAARGVGYGIRSIRVDGNDSHRRPRSPRGTGPRRHALERGGPGARSQAVTDRLGAHSTSDDPTRAIAAARTRRPRRRNDPMRHKHPGLTRSPGLVERRPARRGPLRPALPR